MLLGGVSLQPGGARSRSGPGADEPAGAGAKRHESQTIQELERWLSRFGEAPFLHRGEQAPPRGHRKTFVGRYCVGRDRSRPVPAGETRNRRLPSFQWRTRLRRKKGRVACIGLLKEPHSSLVPKLTHLRVISRVESPESEEGPIAGKKGRASPDGVRTIPAFFESGLPFDTPPSAAIQGPENGDSGACRRE